MRLIDADALCARIKEEFDGVCVYDVSGNEAANDFCNIVDGMPIIDAIPTDILHTRCTPAAESAFQRKMLGCLKIVPVRFKEV